MNSFAAETAPLLRLLSAPAVIGNGLFAVADGKKGVTRVQVTIRMFEGSSGAD